MPCIYTWEAYPSFSNSSSRVDPVASQCPPQCEHGLQIGAKHTASYTWHMRQLRKRRRLDYVRQAHVQRG